MNHLSQEGGVPWDAEEINVQHNSRPAIQLSEGSDEPLKVYRTQTHAGETQTVSMCPPTYRRGQRRVSKPLSPRKPSGLWAPISGLEQLQQVKQHFERKEALPQILGGFMNLIPNPTSN